MAGQATDARQQIVGRWDSPVIPAAGYSLFQMTLHLPTGPGQAANQVAGSCLDFRQGVATGTVSATFDGKDLVGNVFNGTAPVPFRFAYQPPSQLAGQFQSYVSVTLSRKGPPPGPPPKPPEEPALGVFCCFDYTIYRVTGGRLQARPQNVQVVTRLLESYGYRVIAALSAPLYARKDRFPQLPMNYGDVFVMPSHVGYVNPGHLIDHFLQALGPTQGHIVTLKELKALAQSPDAFNTLLTNTHPNLKLDATFLKVLDLQVDPRIDQTLIEYKPPKIPLTSMDYWSRTGFPPKVFNGRGVPEPNGTTWSAESGRADRLFLRAAGRAVSGACVEGDEGGTTWSLRGTFNGFQLSGRLLREQEVRHKPAAGTLALNLTVDDRGFNLAGHVALGRVVRLHAEFRPEEQPPPGTGWEPPGGIDFGK